MLNRTHLIPLLALALLTLASVNHSQLDGWQSTMAGGVAVADGGLKIEPWARAIKTIHLPSPALVQFVVNGDGVEEQGLASTATGERWLAADGVVLAPLPAGEASLVLVAGGGGATVTDITITIYPTQATAAAAPPSPTQNIAAWTALNLGVFLLSGVGAIVVWRYAPAKVVELRTDPPPDAHYIRAAKKEMDPHGEAAVLFQKESEVFFHALMYADGVCSTRQLEKVLDKHWNEHYVDFPEYAKTWTIKRRFIEQTLKKYDFIATGATVQLTQRVGDNFQPEVYVLLPQNVFGGVSKKLVAVRAMAELWTEAAIEPPPPPEVVEDEASEPATAALPDVGTAALPEWASAIDEIMEEEAEL
jgi:hypothetical protein